MSANATRPPVRPAPKEIDPNARQYVGRELLLDLASRTV
jgi:hypothetical protein